jgi:hypothetical protein
VTRIPARVAGAEILRSAVRVRAHVRDRSLMPPVSDRYQLREFARRGGANLGDGKPKAKRRESYIWHIRGISSFLELSRARFTDH